MVKLLVMLLQDMNTKWVLHCGKGCTGWCWCFLCVARPRLGGNYAAAFLPPARSADFDTNVRACNVLRLYRSFIGVVNVVLNHQGMLVYCGSHYMARDGVIKGIIGKALTRGGADDEQQHPPPLSQTQLRDGCLAQLWSTQPASVRFTDWLASL